MPHLPFDLVEAMMNANDIPKVSSPLGSPPVCISIRDDVFGVVIVLCVLFFFTYTHPLECTQNQLTVAYHERATPGEPSGMSCIMQDARLFHQRVSVCWPHGTHAHRCCHTDPFARRGLHPDADAPAAPAGAPEDHQGEAWVACRGQWRHDARLHVEHS